MATEADAAPTLSSSSMLPSECWRGCSEQFLCEWLVRALAARRPCRTLATSRWLGAAATGTRDAYGHVPASVGDLLGRLTRRVHVRRDALVHVHLPHILPRFPSRLTSASQHVYNGACRSSRRPRGSHHSQAGGNRGVKEHVGGSAHRRRHTVQTRSQGRRR